MRPFASLVKRGRWKGGEFDEDGFVSLCSIHEQGAQASLTIGHLSINPMCCATSHDSPSDLFFLLFSCKYEAKGCDMYS